MTHWLSSYVIFVVVAFGSAWLADQLVGLTAPGDTCEGLLLTLTVSLMGLLFLLAIVYLRIAMAAILRERWPDFLRRRPWLHPVGVGCLVFSISTPFVFLAGPQSALAYGERVVVTEALSRSVPLQRAVEDYFARTGQLPQSLAELAVGSETAPAFSALRAVSLMPGGALRLAFGSARYPDVNARHILLVPQIEGSVLSGWDCRGGDLPAGLRPLACRASSVCEAFGYQVAADR